MVIGDFAPLTPERFEIPLESDVDRQLVGNGKAADRKAELVGSCG